MDNIENYNEKLMNLYDYSDKKDIKKMYTDFNNLYELTCNGDTVAASIYMDAKYAAFETNTLTKKQKHYLVEHLINRNTLREIATEEEVDYTTIHGHINGAVKRIQKVLLEPRP